MFEQRMAASFPSRSHLEPFHPLREIFLGTVPNGIYFVNGPIWVRLAVPFGTVPARPVRTQRLNIPFGYRSKWNGSCVKDALKYVSSIGFKTMFSFAIYSTIYKEPRLMVL